VVTVVVAVVVIVVLAGNEKIHRVARLVGQFQASKFSRGFGFSISALGQAAQRRPTLWHAPCRLARLPRHPLLPFLLVLPLRRA
jgi:hypothetical protein